MQTKLLTKSQIGLLVLTILIPGFILADNVIKGKIIDANSGDPIQNVEVIITHSTTGTTTDAHGQFTLTTSNSDVQLDISHIGYENKTVKVHADKQITIQLNATVLPLPNITVISLGFEQTLREAAMPVQVVNQREIQTLAPVTISDAVTLEPGVSVSKDGAWGSQVNIRGLSKQKVVTLIDGNRIETATNIAAGLSLVDVTAVERIEVIKGASSVLYGSGAMGGVVNIITKKNTFQDHMYWHGSLLTSYSSAANQGTGSLNINAGARRWTLGINAMQRKADNLETPEGMLENSQFQDQNFSAQLGILLLKNHSFKLDYQKFYAEDVGIPGGAPFPSTASARYPEEEREMLSAAYLYTPDSNILDRIEFKVFQQTIIRDVELTTPAAIVYPGAEHETMGLQFKSTWQLNNHSFIAGIDAWERELNSTRTKHPIGMDKIIGERPIPLSKYRSIGLFAQDQFELIPQKLKATLGARIDQIHVENEEAWQPEYIIQDGVRTNKPGNNKLWDAESSEDISYSGNLGLIYRLTDDVDVTANIARAFRSPTLEERYQYIALGAATYWGNPDLEPEVGTFIDLGTRFWLSNFNLTINGFVNYLTNLVVDQYESAGVYRMANIGEARLFGFDTQAALSFWDHYAVYGSLAYVRGEDTKNNADLPEIPPFNGRLGIRAWIANLVKVDASVNMHADQDHVATGEVETKGFNVFDLYLTSKMINLAGVNGRLILGIENITDEAYRYHLSTYRGLIRLEPGRSFEATWLMEL